MLYIGNHTSSSRGYLAMVATHVHILPEIQEEGKPKTLIRRMCRHLGSWQRRIILESWWLMRLTL